MDFPVNIHGLDLTLKDASTWVNPGVGYVIDLTTKEGRDELVEHRAALQEARNIETARRDAATSQRSAFVEGITEDTRRITLIRDFLSAVGDDPDA